MTRCLSTADFIDYAQGNGSYQPHVSQCARCRAIAEVLHCAAVVDDLEIVVAEVERRMDAATSAATELESALPHRWDSIASSDSRLHGPEGVRALLARAGANYATTPRRSLALARLAVTCAEIARVAPAVHFDALKDYAKFALRAADDLTTAFAALDRAAELVAETDDPEYYAALLAHTRAYIYGDSACARWNEALEELDACGPLKEREPQRWRATRHLRAAVLVRRGSYAAAAALYEQLRAGQTDTYSRALLTSDLAECYSRMGRPAEALPLADLAIEVFRQHGQTLAAARAMWVRGVALSGIGMHNDAIETLEAVIRIFAVAGLTDDELATELALLTAIRNADPDADVVARLENAYMLAAALDEAQPLRSGAFRAAVWAELRDAYDRKALSPELLAHATDYLRTIGRGDEAPFVRLQ